MATLNTPQQLRALAREVKHIAAQIPQISENARLDACLAQSRIEVETLKRWLLNQKRETDKWRSAYAELALKTR